MLQIVVLFEHNHNSLCFRQRLLEYSDTLLALQTTKPCYPLNRHICCFLKTARTEHSRSLPLGLSVTPLGGRALPPRCLHTRYGDPLASHQIPPLPAVEVPRPAAWAPPGSSGCSGPDLQDDPGESALGSTSNPRRAPQTLDPPFPSDGSQLAWNFIHLVSCGSSTTGVSCCKGETGVVLQHSSWRTKMRRTLAWIFLTWKCGRGGCTISGNGLRGGPLGPFLF